MQKLKILLILCVIFSACQTVSKNSASILLPSIVDETSGLATIENDFLTFNDSGGDASLYRLNQKGIFIEEFPIHGAVNRDWEDIAQDDTYYYIADTGNNYAKRKDLTIYIVDKGFVLIDSIHIRYADQKKFVKKKKNKYDAEALVSIGDSLVLFSKNRKSHKTRVYSFPKEPGSYVLEKKITYDVDALITGADFSSVNNRLVLTGYLPDYRQFLFLTENFSLNQLDQQKLKRYQLPLDNAQVEAVKILPDNSIWISSEGEGVNTPFLFKIDSTLNNIIK